MRKFIDFLSLGDLESLTNKMEKKRKIAKVVRQLTFEEAEAADDEYWSKTSVEERLDELESLRKMLWPNATGKIKKVVKKRYLYEEEE